MKKLNLIKRLWTDSHEKQSPQRFGRYAVMLIMLLTLGVGQMWATNTYYYSGNGNYSDNIESWHLDQAMTISDDGYYEYYYVSSHCTHRFKIGVSGNTYAYNYTYVTAGHNSTNVSNVGGYSNDACYCWHGSAHYILVYYPNTIKNGTNKPIICASTTLPDNRPTLTYYGNTNNTGTAPAATRYKEGATVTVAGNTGTLAKNNCSFAGWNTQANGLGADRAASSTFTMPSSNVSLYAKWTTTVYFVDYDSWDAVYAYAWEGTGGTGHQNATFDSAPTMSKIGKTYDSKAIWKIDNILGTWEKIIFKKDGSNKTADLTFSPGKMNPDGNNINWQNLAYDVTLNPQGGSDGTESIIAECGSAMPGSKTAPSNKTGYTFGGYYVGVGGGGLQYYNGSMSSVRNWPADGSGPTTLYAKWTQSVTLNRNGASTGSTSANVTYNSATISAITAPSLDNYTFGGWYPNDDGTGGQVINTSGVLQGNVTNWTGVSSEWQHAGASTLYAKWTQNITLDPNTSNHGSGTSTSATVATLNATSVSNFSATSAADGYHVIGYFTDATGGTKVLEADGSFAASNISGYITGGKWTRTSSTTLYAQLSAHEWALYHNSGASKLGDLEDRGEIYTINLNIITEGVSANNDTWNFKMDGSTAFYFGADPPTGTWRNLTQGLGLMSWGWGAGWKTISIRYNTDHWEYRGDASPLISYDDSPTGGSVEVTSGWDANLGTTSNHVTYGSDVTFIASNNTGYTFDGWYGASNFSGDKLSEDNPLAISGVTANTSRYAKFTENMATLTANDGDHGTVAITAGTSEIGISTSATITATPATHYHVARWETSSNVVTVSGGGANSSITVRTDGTGDAATVTPIYAEDNSTFKLYKQTSAGTSGVDEMWGYLGAATYSITLSDLPADTTYKIYVYDSSSDNKHYRNSGGSITVNHKSDKIYKYDTDDTGHYFSFKTSVAGTYTITFAYTSNPGTLSATYPVEPSYSATLSLKDGTTPGCSVSPRTGAITLRQYEYTTITATAEPGFRFKQWNTSGCAFANSTTSTDATASFTATANGATIEAEFTNDGFIYFDNTMSKWGGDIYVYFFNTSNWWYNDKNDGKGPGVVADQNVHYHKMDQIPGTQIYYYDYHVANPATNAICFTSGDHHSSSGLWKTSAAWRSDFNSCLPCYIASENASQWKNETGYHNAGYWKRWGNTESGFTLYYKDGSNPEQHIDFTNSDPYSFIYNAEITLSSANSNYKYNVARCNGGKKLRRKDYSGSIQDSDSDYPRELSDGANDDGTLRTSAAGTYKIQLSLASDHIMMTVEYPLSVGDYRVRLVNDSKNHSSGRIIRARGDKSRTDTVSFFIDHTKAASNVLYVDSCTSTGNPPGWNRISDVAKATLSLNTDPYNATTGVYKFGLKHTNHKDVELVLLEEPEYDGAYYVRTDGLDGKWTAYMTTPDNKMQYSKKSLDTKANYDYYVPKWIENGTNVQFTIANDYSPCISDTLYGDTETGGADKAHQTLPADANVRFMWNSGNNRISRAYLDGATVVGSHFLELHSETSGKIFNKSDGVVTDTIFEDTKNWIYQVDIKALPGAKASLTAQYNGQTQDLIDGGGYAQQLIGGDEEDDTKYNLRMVYDFKTNILISAWIAETELALGTTTLALDADLMIVRHLQEHAAQITFTTGSISEIKTIYGALRFDYDDMVGKMDNWYASGIYSKLIYDVSFPFDVNVKDIFGVGQMGDHWVIQKYNGAKRAKEGLFLGDDDTYWEDLTADSVMHAYEGYTVFIDRPSFNSSESVIWNNKEEGGSVYLYFPSASVDDKTISRGDITLHFDSLNCKIDRSFNDPDNEGKVLYHKYTDSNWRMIGTPLLSDTMGNFSELFRATINYDDTHPFRYLYAWDPSDNSYYIASTTSFTFKTMHGYMVQYAGDITFKGTYIHKAPSRIVAAEQTNDDMNYLIDLQMTNADEKMVHTYVELRNNACDTFALNEDVYMVRSSSMADLYTYAGDYDVAANVLSVGNHIVPVGMNVKKAGTYTFSMPNSFNGTVTLIDTYTGARTNLAMSDYTVNLPKGVNNERFQLEINISKVPTAIDGVEGGSLKDGKAHKFIMNDMLYILNDGVIFDARGNRVK